VANEHNDSLSGGFVLPVFESQLSNLDGGDDVGVALDLDVVDAVD
jgi:hypothetical protein